MTILILGWSNPLTFCHSGWKASAIWQLSISNYCSVIVVLSLWERRVLVIFWIIACLCVHRINASLVFAPAETQYEQSMTYFAQPLNSKNKHSQSWPQSQLVYYSLTQKKHWCCTVGLCFYATPYNLTSNNRIKARENNVHQNLVSSSTSHWWRCEINVRSFCLWIWNSHSMRGKQNISFIQWPKLEKNIEFGAWLLLFICP